MSNFSSKPPQGKCSQLSVADSILSHALFWLLLSTLVGLVLAASIVFPNLQPFLGTTFGNLLPLHTHWVLYGWCGLGLSALLFALYLVSQRDRLTPWAHLWVWLWSGSLALGGYSWLMGHTSGKLFLDWEGTARFAFVGVMVLLWVLLGAATWTNWNLPETTKRQRWTQLGILPVLGIPPIAMVIATSPNHYPPVNPASGGATGTSLFGSTLGIIFLMLLLPYLIKRPIAKNARIGWIWFFFACQLVGFVLLDHNHVSNSDGFQILALASLGVWLPILAFLYAKVSWKRAIHPWLRATGLWGILLWLNGFCIFLPHYLVHAKFTQILVSHAHLAMAGFTTSFLVAILAHLAPKGLPAFSNRVTFWTWQISSMAMVISLTGLGILEGKFTGISYNPNSAYSLLLALRLVAGLGMALPAFSWWIASLSPLGLQPMSHRDGLMVERHP